MRSAKVLLVASGGGHWKQLLLIASKLSEHDLVYATTNPEAKDDVKGAHLYAVHDSNRDTMLGLFRTTLELISICLRVRPAAIISTGAAPGYIAIRIGKLLGAQTMFVDSFANAETLSMSAQLSINCADVTLTQWPHLAEAQGAQYGGSVL
jgi:UDP-N-acetylglucosamine:LPS N-acetylglucosamine transferase